MREIGYTLPCTPSMTQVVIGQSIVSTCVPDHAFVVADTAVASMIARPTLVLDGGEKLKTRKMKEHVEDALFSSHVGKRSTIVAIGGGSLLDLVGFVAAIYYRGVRLILVPTTLLAMVDASIGGKNGINLPGCKNCIGTIYHPEQIIVDLDFLKTLEEQEMKNGLVEMLKHAILSGYDAAYELERDRSKIMQKDAQTLSKHIEQHIAFKMGVIQHGDRDILNFGHTIGHALEALEQFSLSHGEAVFHGMRMESFLCKEMGILSEKGYRHIQKMLHAAHIHTMPNSYPFEEMLEVMVRDKKGLSFVALEDIGKVRKEHLFQIEHTVLQHYLDLYDKTVSLCIG